MVKRMVISFTERRSGEFVMLTDPVNFLWRVFDGQKNLQIQILKFSSLAVAVYVSHFALSDIIVFWYLGSSVLSDVFEYFSNITLTYGVLF